MTENQSLDGDNVIRGPWRKKVINQSEAEILRREEMEFCEELSQKITMDMIQVMGDNDVDMSDKTFSRDLTIIIEFVKSLLYRDAKLEYPLHNFVDAVTETTVELDNSHRTVIRVDILNDFVELVKMEEDDDPDVS